MEKNSEDSWTIYDVTLQGGNLHKYRMVQTGEPLLSKYTFKNLYDEQPVTFYANILSGEDRDATISNLKLVIEGCAIVNIPTILKAGDKIYSDGKMVYVCDSFGMRKTVIHFLKQHCGSEGDNIVNIECDFYQKSSLCRI